jgi:zinc protease
VRRLLRVSAVWVVALAMGSTAAAQVPDWPTEKPPRPLAPREVKFPPYQMRTLKNGLQVIAVSHHEQPAVTIRLIVRAGSANDPAPRPGVATLAAALLDQGTTTKSAEQIATTIDSIGGAMGAGSGSDLTFVNAAVMKDSLAVGLDLVSDVVRNPAFAPDEIDRQRQQILSTLKVSYEDPDYIAGVVFDRLVYGFHPYGKPDSGTPAAVASVTRADLVAFHKQWFGANNAILAIVGDVTAEEAFAGAERAFGAWNQVTLATEKPDEPPAPTRRVVIIDRPGAVQTEVRIGNIGLPRKHADYLALDIMSKILGGEGGNRLHRVLRSERGLTYGAAVSNVSLKETGHIVADTDTRSDSTAEVLRLTVDEISRLQRQRVSQRELSDAQAYLTGSFPLTIETPGAIAMQVLNGVFYGLDLNELETYRERVNAITPEDIQRVAQKYLHPDRLSIVLVGDASVFAKQLAGVGFDHVERIPLADLDLSSVNLRRGSAAPGGLRPVAYRQTPDAADASGLIARAVQAKGGLVRLRSLRTVKALSDTVIEGPKGKVSFATTTYIRYPGQFRIDAARGDATLVQAFDNGRAWVQDERGPADAPLFVTQTMQASVQRDPVALLLALTDKRVAGKRIPDVVVDGTAMPALVAEARPMGAVTLLLDPKTGLIARQRYRVPTDPKHIVEEVFSDYRDVSGIQVAFKVTVRGDGVTPMDRLVRSFEVDVPIEAALFTRPS